MTENTLDQKDRKQLSTDLWIIGSVAFLAHGLVHDWCPFQGVGTTAEALASAFPSNVLALALTAIFWGFFEGFNYVVIRDKISQLFPSKYRFGDWGAFICAVMCILIHGAVGLTPDALLQMATVFILIYGMLIVRKETGNAWRLVYPVEKNRDLYNANVQ